MRQMHLYMYEKCLEIELCMSSILYFCTLDEALRWSFEFGMVWGKANPEDAANYMSKAIEHE